MCSQFGVGQRNLMVNSAISALDQICFFHVADIRERSIGVACVCLVGEPRVLDIQIRDMGWVG